MFFVSCTRCVQIISREIFDMYGCLFAQRCILELSTAAKTQHTVSTVRGDNLPLIRLNF